MSNGRGFSLIEILLAAALLSVAALAAVAHMTHAAGHADWARDKVFARQKALSIAAELRSFVVGMGGSTASDLDDFDDGATVHPTLSIASNPDDPGAHIEPEHLLSGNILERGQWRWYRQITVRPVQGQERNDLRECTVRVYRMRPGEAPPGEMMAQVATVIRSVGESYAASQVFDVYLLALENVPAWWVTMDAVRPFVDSALQELETRNPGLKFRSHWIHTLGYGRDEEYAPYTNETRDSRANTPWVYVYPGALPSTEMNRHYYLPDMMRGRVNLDGETVPAFINGFAAREPFSDDNGSGWRDPGETFVDADGDGDWDPGNTIPYAFADQHNHCMRHPDAEAKFAARVTDGIDDEATPTWRLLLDRMVAHPEQFTNAILVNLHGELLPMPPTRNFSDAASDPERHPGWRVVTHPERIHARRVQGSDAGSDAPRFRVHAWKTAFPVGHEPLMTQAEPYVDTDRNGRHDAGEPYQDWNGNNARDAGTAISIILPGADFSASPNGAVTPSILVERLPGGIDADGSGSPDPYVALQPAPRYPEPFQDGNGDGIRQVAELYFDLDGNGVRDAYDPHQELDGDGAYAGITEMLTDGNGNGRFDPDRPAETLTDANGNGRWDPAEPFWDRNGNGLRDGPTTVPTPTWQAWSPTTWGNTAAETRYVADFGEPFLDRDGDGRWDAAEAFTDDNGNGVHDGGFVRGEMWYSLRYQSWPGRTVLLLHGTPLETPQVGAQGLPPQWRLYDLGYVPCPTPDSSAAGGNRFARDLAVDGDFPKNTARWRITLPSASVRRGYESTPGSADGDAADRVIRLETRIGSDLDTGAMWPSWYYAQNLSSTYTWFYGSADDVPFSERHQIRGDPRHCPYEDTDRHGNTAGNGYNWFWDDLQDGTGSVRDHWLALDGARLSAGWLGRGDHDVARMMQWLRTGIVDAEAFFTTMAGFSFYYLSAGGDVGSDAANDQPNSIPMDGLPFGRGGDVFENTISGSPGTGSVAGSRKFVRSNAGADAGLRAGGYWWSKPFLGELCPDEAYATQWKLHGNLTAASSASGRQYRLVRRDDIGVNQLPRGTSFAASIASTSAEGSTSFFNIGTANSTFHHQFRGGQQGSLVEAGLPLASTYAYPIPPRVPISRPFSVASNNAGGVGPEFAYPNAFPRYAGAVVTRFYDHDSADVGSGLVRLRSPAGSGGYITLSGLDKATENGSAFIARYSVIALVQSVFEAGVPGAPNRVRQLPRVEIRYPTLSDEIDDPVSITLRWSTEWTRWDGRKYTDAYPDGFTENADDLTYLLLYSKDNGDTWLHMLDDSKAQPGKPPWIDGVGPDPRVTLSDAVVAGDETWTWATPASRFPRGSYLVRIEAHRKSVRRHYAVHMEKIHVGR